MRPVLFRWRGFTIHAYPAFLFIGLTVGVVVGTQVGSAWGLPTIRLYAALILLCVPAVFGARLLYVVSHLDIYRRDPKRIVSRQDGGAALYGGLLLALACSWPLLKLLRLPFGAFWDAAAVTILVGMVFTKVGCLLNGCCAGRPTSNWFGVMLPNSRGVWCRRIPAQPLEMVLALLLLSGGVWTPRPFGGAFFLASLAVYAAARLPLGAARETVDRIGGVSVNAAISVALVAASLAGLAVAWWN